MKGHLLWAGLLATGCAAPYHEVYDAADSRLRGLAAYRESPAGTAEELRARFMPGGRAAVPDAPAIDLSAAVALDAVIKAAIESNADLRAGVARARAAIEEIPQAAFPETPRLELSPEVGLSRHIFGLREIELMITQIFPPSGLLDAQVAAAAAHARQEIARVVEMENQIRSKVTAAFAEIDVIDRAKETNRTNREAVGAIVNSAEAAYSAGNVSQQDVLRSQLRLQELDLRDLELRWSRRDAEARLNNLVNRHPGSPVGPLRLSETIPSIPKLKSLLEQIEATRPNLRVAAQQLDAALTGLRLAELGYSPDVAVGAEPTWSHPKQGPSASILDLAVSVPLKFLHSEKFEAAEREARAEVAEAISTYQGRRLHARQEVVSAFASLSLARDMHKLLTDELIPSARQTFEAADTAYENNQVDLDTLLQSHVDLQDLEERLDRARAHAWRAAAELQAAVGNSLEAP